MCSVVNWSFRLAGYLLAVAERLLYQASAFVHERLIRAKPGVEFEGRLRVKGWPLIHAVEGARVVLGDNVMLNSRNRGYHVNMYAPVKLFADRPDAEISIGANSRIHGTCVHAYRSVTIGRNCLIAANTQIFDGSGHDLSFDNVENRINTVGHARPVVIEDNTWIGANCIVLPGVRIGEGSVVAAGSVVVKDVPCRVIVGGNPAKVIRHF